MGLNANGTAVVVVCVTWRNPPVDCPGSGVGKSPGGPARYGAIFAITVRAGYCAIAVQGDSL
jgi:hypothetical protein